MEGTDKLMDEVREALEGAEPKLRELESRIRENPWPRWRSPRESAWWPACC